jgi:peptidoglycan/xylan/chitin deacetylase (PgdA/CDA1 family)
MYFKRVIVGICAAAAFCLFAFLSGVRDNKKQAQSSTAQSPADSATNPIGAETAVAANTEGNFTIAPIPDLFFHGARTQKRIALTFDACPAGKSIRYDPAIAETLISTNTPATIFLSGEWVLNHKSETRALAASPLFEFGNHSYSHPHMTLQKEDHIKAELLRTQAIIAKVTGRTPTLFRPPYGEWNDTLVCAAREIGLVTVQYDLASGDPDTLFTSERLIRYVSKEARSGSVIVMHINGRGWHTAEALPSIIADLREKGFDFVKVSDLMKPVGKATSNDDLGHSNAD